MVITYALPPDNRRLVTLALFRLAENTSLPRNVRRDAETLGHFIDAARDIRLELDDPAEY
jgi:uncharacterized protein (UPF0147 family)